MDERITTLRSLVTERSRSNVLTVSMLVFLSGCGFQFPSRPRVIEVPVATETTVMERLVPVEIMADSAVLVALFGMDSLNNVYLKELTELKTSRIRSFVELKKNQLTYKVVTVHDTVYVRSRDSIVYKDKPVRVEVPIEVNKLTGWQQVQIWLGRAMMVLLGIGIIIGITKLKK